LAQSAGSPRPSSGKPPAKPEVSLYLDVKPKTDSNQESSHQ
jgi:hypothetical protein